MLILACSQTLLKSPNRKRDTMYNIKGKVTGKILTGFKNWITFLKLSNSCMQRYYIFNSTLFPKEQIQI